MRTLLKNHGKSSQVKTFLWRKLFCKILKTGGRKNTKAALSTSFRELPCDFQDNFILIQMICQCIFSSVALRAAFIFAYKTVNVQAVVPTSSRGFLPHRMQRTRLSHAWLSGFSLSSENGSAFVSERRHHVRTVTMKINLH